MVFSKKKVIIAAIVVLGVVLLGVIIFIFSRPQRPQGPPPKSADLAVWGVFDDSSAMNPIVAGVRAARSNITASYRKLTIEEYEEALLNAFAVGKGPDVFMVNNTWLPRYMEKIVPAPPLTIDERTFRSSYVDVAADDLVIGGKIYGIPLHVDTLALFYNTVYLASEGIVFPPKTWDEFLVAVEKLTRRDERGNIKRAGAALGTARNVNRSMDILSALMIQQGAKMMSDDRLRAAFADPVPTAQGSFLPGERALAFYTDFANPQKRVYAWNVFQHFSVDAFIAEEAAMMINYARIIPLLEGRAPYLKWNVAPLPQIAQRDFDVNYANYWVLVVAVASKQQAQAWQLLTYMGGRDAAKRYLDATGRPTARRDLIENQRDNLKLGTFALQSLTARSWYQADNREVEKIFADMVESVVSGNSSVYDAVGRAAGRVSAVRP